MHLKDKSYKGLDKFITAFKKVTGKSKFNRGRYGVSNTMGGILNEISAQKIIYHKDKHYGN